MAQFFIFAVMEFHVHHHHFQTKEIMGALEDIKEKLEISDEKIEILVTATEGVTQDMAYVKRKLDENQGGIDATGVAELREIVTAQSDRLSEASSKLKALDDETDSTGGQGPQEPSPEGTV